MDTLFELLDTARDTDIETLAKIQKHLDGHVPICLASKHTKRSGGYSYNTVKNVDSVPMTPFNYALAKSKWKCAKYLFELDPRALILFPEDFNTPLHEVARCDNQEFLLWFWNDSCVQQHLSMLTPQDFNQRNEDKLTALMMAVKTQKTLELITVWGNRYHDVSAKDDKGRNVLHLAIEHKQIEFILLLLKAYASLATIPNIILPSTSGQYPLHLAANNNLVSVMNALCQSGADTCVTDGDLNTPLHIAARSAHFESMQFLLMNNARVMSLNWAGDTALHLVVRSHEAFGVKFEQALCLLLSYGADPHAENGKKETPWSIARELFAQEKDKPKRLQFTQALQKHQEDKALEVAAQLVCVRARECLPQPEQETFFNSMSSIAQPPAVKANTRYWNQPQRVSQEHHNHYATNRQ